MLKMKIYCGFVKCFKKIGFGKLKCFYVYISYLFVNKF